jgi:hypothetical protein
MATNLDLDPDLIERALALSGAPTKKAAVTAALQEFTARREQRGLLELFSKLEWDPAYDYKRERTLPLNRPGDTAQRVNSKLLPALSTPLALLKQLG